MYRQDKHLKYLINEYLLDNLKQNNYNELINMLIQKNQVLENYINEKRKINKNE